MFVCHLLWFAYCASRFLPLCLFARPGTSSALCPRLFPGQTQKTMNCRLRHLQDFFHERSKLQSRNGITPILPRQTKQGSQVFVFWCRQSRWSRARSKAWGSNLGMDFPVENGDAAFKGRTPKRFVGTLISNSSIPVPWTDATLNRCKHSQSGAILRIILYMLV